MTVVLGISLLVPIPAASQGRVPGYESIKPLGPNGEVIPRRAIPRAANGKPDFTGVWAGPGYSHQVGPYDTDIPRIARIDPKAFPPFKPGGESFFFQPHNGDLAHDDPTSVCLPSGISRLIFTFLPQQWIQAPDHMVVIYESQHFPRVIPIGAPNRPHSDFDGEKTWMGDAIGWWEGATFVIDTIGIREWQWDVSGRWHSDQLHMIERLTYTDPMTVRYDMTFDDPAILTKPLTPQTFGMKLHPTWRIMEHVCEENNRCEAGKCSQ